MNRSRGRRSGVIWHGWAHEPVPLLLLRERERENQTEQACWLQTDIWLLNPQATAVTEQAVLSFFLWSFWEFSPLPSPFSSLGELTGYSESPGSGLECAYRGGKAWQLDSFTLFLVFFASFWRLLLEVSFQALESGSTCVTFHDYSEFFFVFLHTFCSTNFTNGRESLLKHICCSPLWGTLAGITQIVWV